MDTDTLWPVAGRLLDGLTRRDFAAVADASASQIGDKVCLRWRIRMSPDGGPGRARVVEQHLYLTGDECVATVDLLCSGFHAESSASVVCALP